MTVSDVFNHLKNAGCDADMRDDEIELHEGAGLRIKCLPNDKWLLSHTDGVGEVVTQDSIISVLKDIMVSVSLPSTVELVVRRLVWYFGSDDLFIMRRWFEIVNDTHSVVNIGSFNDVLLNFFNGQLRGINIVTGDTYSFKTIEEVMDACGH